MLQGEVLEKEKIQSLSALENIFNYALDQESKCLIQACILIVEQEFAGASSFSHQTQIKFLLESIRHIINDNCQEEFIHIVQYLKLVRSLCSDVGCDEEYVNTILKIKQSFILYTLLDNESASDVCRIMNDFFPKEDPLFSFAINKASMKRRFLALIRRQIYTFQRLVTKLLTDMEFRSYYFYDEWMEDFGTTFHKEMVSDINSYLEKTEEFLLNGIKSDEIYKSWILPDSICNPSVLYFLKILHDNKKEEVPEEDILNLIIWMFPSLDTTLLTMPSKRYLKVPTFLNDKSFQKVFLEAERNLFQRKPWEFENLQQTLKHIMEQKSMPKPKKNFTSCVKSEVVTYSNKTKDKKEKERIPFGEINENALSNKSHIINTRKRKLAGVESVGNLASKRRRLNNKLSPSKIESKKRLTVDLGKKNAFVKTPGDSTKLKFKIALKSAINISCDSPQCKKLLESGSKFFSAARTKKKTQSCIISDLSTPILDEVSNEIVQFSDNEEDTECKSGSEKLSVTKETMGLTWICTSKNSKSTPRSHSKLSKKTCRTLSFKSESSDLDDRVSESESELPVYLQPTLQDCFETLDSALLPDLTFHVKNLATKPCTVRLDYLSEMALLGSLAENYTIGDADLETILSEDVRFRFRNYNLTKA